MVRHNKKLLRLISFYPPFLGAGIRLKEASPDFRRLVVELKLRWFNRNLYGAHFGGSLYSMCDPFHAIIIQTYLGDKYIVLAKSGHIEFKKPGTGTVRAIFEIEDAVLEQLKKKVDRSGKHAQVFPINVVNNKNETVAEVKVEVYIRKRR